MKINLLLATKVALSIGWEKIKSAKGWGLTVVQSELFLTKKKEIYSNLKKNEFDRLQVNDYYWAWKQNTDTFIMLLMN